MEYSASTSHQLLSADSSIRIFEIADLEIEGRKKDMKTAGNNC